MKRTIGRIQFAWKGAAARAKQCFAHRSAEHCSARPLMRCLIGTVIIALFAGCGTSKEGKKKDEFFTSGNRGADQRASQTMAKDEQIRGSEEGKKEDKKLGYVKSAETDKFYAVEPELVEQFKRGGKFSVFYEDSKFGPIIKSIKLSEVAPSATKPSAAPTSTSDIALCKTSLRTSFICAPNAMRIPISCVRCATAYEVTP